MKWTANAGNNSSIGLGFSPFIWRLKNNWALAKWLKRIWLKPLNLNNIFPPAKAGGNWSIELGFSPFIWRLNIIGL